MTEIDTQRALEDLDRSLAFEFRRPTGGDIATVIGSVAYSAISMGLEAAYSIGTSSRIKKGASRITSLLYRNDGVSEAPDASYASLVPVPHTGVEYGL